MITRKIDTDNDWTFGKGRNNYLRNNDAVQQSIQTRLQSFLGDCFFSTSSGIDWWNLLGSKNTVALDISITTTILNTPGVSALVELNTNLNENRSLTISYQVVSVYSQNQTLNGSVTIGV